MKFLLFTLALVISFAALDRLAAYLYLPGENAREVIIYTTQRCPYCKKLRTLLDRNGIPYVERDVETSIAGVLGFWALRARGVPVTVVGSEVIYGYGLNKIEASLGRIGYQLSAAPRLVE